MTIINSKLLMTASNYSKDAKHGKEKKIKKSYKGTLQ